MDLSFLKPCVYLSPVDPHHIYQVGLLLASHLYKYGIKNTKSSKLLMIHNTHAEVVYAVQQTFVTDFIRYPEPMKDTIHIYIPKSIE